MYISTQRLDAYVDRIYALALQYLTVDDQTIKEELIDRLKGLLQAGGDLGIIDLSTGVERVIYLLYSARENVIKDWSEGQETFNKHYFLWRSIINDSLTEEAVKTFNPGN